VNNNVEIKKTHCGFCSCRCGLEVRVKNGEVVKIIGDKEAGTKGFMCRRPRLAALDFHDDPRRLNYPMKRNGARGEGKWQQISWKDAMDEIAEKIVRVRESDGPEAVACMMGNGTGGARWMGHRWCNLLGTPNRFTTNMNCLAPQLIVMFCMTGSYFRKAIPPEPGRTRCMVISGGDPYHSHPPQWNLIVESKKKGAKLIVVDPRATRAVELADLWLQIRPGTDAALLYGMINLIIREDLFDKEFVSKWCQGFDEVKAYVDAYPPEVVERITWIPKDKVIAAARLYGTNRPAQMGTGRGVTYSQLGPGVLQANLARGILQAITGNLDVEGGVYLGGGLDPTRVDYDANMYWDGLISHPLRTRDNVSADSFPVGSVKGLKLFREIIKKAYNGGFSPDVGLAPHVSPYYMWRAILEQNPYPIKAMITWGVNPLATRTNIRSVYEALKSKNLELSVVSELFMMPTAMLADYVFPSVDWLESKGILLAEAHAQSAHFKPTGYIHEQSVAPKFERRNDYDFWRELGIRVGQEKYWPETIEEMCSQFLKPSGYDFTASSLQRDHVSDKARMPAGKYRKYEKDGFATLSGKVELIPSLLNKLGYELLAPYAEPSRSPTDTPELAKAYPYILITGGKTRDFKHSMLREQAKLRKLHPDPIVQLHPDVASRNRIADGDWVYIETPEGKIKQRAEVTPKIHPQVVHVEHGWWFPEQPGEDPNLFGLWESNAGFILPDEPETCDFQGGPPMRGLLCRISRA
jgi:anaerobic selenocysteine-containing dehydrogenase